MDQVMMDYLARKMRGNDYGYDNRGGDQGRGTYNISGRYDNADRDMNYPMQGDKHCNGSALRGSRSTTQPRSCTVWLRKALHLLL